jgi:hypothetical protein
MPKSSKADKLFTKMDVAVTRLITTYDVPERLLYNLTDLARKAERASIVEELNA